MTKFLSAAALGRKTAEFTRGVYHIDIDPGYTVEDVLTPSFWAHQVQLLNINDIIDVVARDGSYDLTLRVVSKGPGFVQMRALRVWMDKASAKSTEEPVNSKDLPRVDWGGPHHKWRVLGHDGSFVKTGIALKDDAQQVLDDYISKSSVAA